MVQFMAQRLMELDVKGRCGAGYDEKSTQRVNSRNCYRDRTWDARAGCVKLKIPTLAQGSDFPEFLEPRRTAEKAPTAGTRKAGCIVSVAVIVAVGVNTGGQREVFGLQVGASEAEPLWAEFLRSLNRRGLPWRMPARPSGAWSRQPLEPYFDDSIADSDRLQGSRRTRGRPGVV